MSSRSAALYVSAAVMIIALLAYAFYQTQNPEQKEWHKVTDVEGSGSTNETIYFDIKGERFSVTWRYEVMPRQSSSFNLLVQDDEHTKILVKVSFLDEPGRSGQEIIDEGPGRFHIHLVGENLDSWKILVEDFY